VCINPTYARRFIPRLYVGFGYPGPFKLQRSMNTIVDSASAALQLILSGDAGLWAIVTRSLAVSVTATCIAFGVGLLAGSWLASARFRGRGAVLTLLNTALAVPAVVVGLVIYLLMSRSGPLGFLGWLFSFQAMVIAQVVLVLPLVISSTLRKVSPGFADASKRGGETSTENSCAAAGSAQRARASRADRRITG